MPRRVRIPALEDSRTASESSSPQVSILCSSVTQHVATCLPVTHGRLPVVQYFPGNLLSRPGVRHPPPGHPNVPFGSPEVLGPSSGDVLLPGEQSLRLPCRSRCPGPTSMRSRFGYSYEGDLLPSDRWRSSAFCSLRVLLLSSQTSLHTQFAVRGQFPFTC